MSRKFALRGHLLAAAALLGAGLSLSACAEQPKVIVEHVDIGDASTAPLASNHAARVCDGSATRVSLDWHPMYFMTIDIAKFTPQGMLPYDTIAAPVTFHQERMERLDRDCRGFALKTSLRRDELNTHRSFIDYVLLSSHNGQTVRLKHGTIEVNGSTGHERTAQTISFDAGDGLQLTGEVHINPGPEYRTLRMALDHPVGTSSSGLSGARALPQERAGVSLGSLTGSSSGGYRSGDPRADIGGFGKIVH